MKIVTSKSQIQIIDIEDNLRHVRRQHYWSQDSVHRDIFLNGWIVFITRSHQKHIGFKVQNNVYWVTDSNAVFLPAFEMIEWHIPKGDILWEAYRFNKDDDLNQLDPMCFRWPQNAVINSKSDIVKILSELENPYYFREGRKLNSVAESSLKFLHKNYIENYSLAEISKKLGYSHSTMTHYFKNAFGLSPVKYRRMLRLAHAAYLIASQQQTITKACFDCGFSDYSTFEDGFKSRYGVQPRQLSRTYQMRANKSLD